MCRWEGELHVKISKQGERFIRYYSLYMGKLEELEMNMFHLGDTRIYIPGQFGQWCRTKPIDVKSWYKVVENTYLEVNEDEKVENRYEWMLNNLSNRIKVCVMKIEALEMK